MRRDWQRVQDINIELIQEYREPDYPEFPDRVSRSTLTFLRARLNNGGYEKLVPILSPPWQKLVDKIMSTDKIAISVSQRDASLLISELRIP
jgi:hypothetical protein